MMAMVFVMVFGGRSGVLHGTNYQVQIVATTTFWEMVVIWIQDRQ